MLGDGYVVCSRVVGIDEFFAELMKEISERFKTVVEYVKFRICNFIMIF